MLKFQLAATINGSAVSLDLCNNDTFVLLEADLGFPEVRKVVDDKANQHGAFDNSMYFGSRAVTADVLVKQGALISFAQALDMVATFTRPDINITLTYNLGAGHVDRMMYLKAAGASGKATSFSNREMQLQFTAADPFCYATAATTGSLLPDSFALSGRSYDEVYDKTYPAGTGSNYTATVTSSVSAQPVITVYGPVASDLVIGNYSSGKLMSFTTLVLALGEFVIIDMKNRTALVGGTWGSNAYGSIEWSGSEWWELNPGQNLVYYGGAVSAGAYATISWNVRFLT